jgi:hypothetical protein
MNIPALHRPLVFPTAHPPHNGWKFWLFWVGFTILGCGLGLLITDSFSLVAQKVFVPYVIGLTAGLLQGMVLRLGVSGTVRWTLATVLGVVLSNMVRPYMAFHINLITSGAVGGLIIGGIQGVVFYTQIPGMAWWVLIKTISGAISWGLGWSILTQVNRLIGHSPSGQVLIGTIAIALIWGLTAAMTGPVMYRLLVRRHRKPPSPRPPAT